MKWYQYVKINSAQKHSGKHIKQDANIINLTGCIIKCFEVSKHFFIFSIHVTNGVASEISTALLTFLSFLGPGMICLLKCLQLDRPCQYFYCLWILIFNTQKGGYAPFLIECKPVNSLHPSFISFLLPAVRGGHVVHETSAYHLTSHWTFSFMWGYFVHSDSIKFTAHWRLYFVFIAVLCKLCWAHLFW